MLNCVDRLQFAGRGSTIYLGKVKAAGQLLVLSEDSDLGAVEEPSESDVLGAGSDDPIQMGDVFGA